MVGSRTSGAAEGRWFRGVAAGGVVALLAFLGGCGDNGAKAGSGGSGGTSTGTGGQAGDAGGTGGGGPGGTGGPAGGTGGGGAGGTGGPGAAVTEIESNDTTATANDFAAIAVNGRVTAAIGVAGDNDYFAVTIPDGINALYITTFSSGVDTTCANANTTLALIAPDATTQLAISTNISATQLCSHISYAPTPGTYFIRVTGNGSTTTIASYVLAVRAETLPAPTPETEPNDDGTPSLGNGMRSFEGNDFSSAAANGPYSADTLITGALDPAGDEDVFAIKNTGTSPAEVYLETFNGGFGACADGLDTQIRIRDAAGNVLAFDDDASLGRFCSFLPYVVPAGSTVYAHVIDFGDNTAAPAYSLHVSFP